MAVAAVIAAYMLARSGVVASDLGRDFISLLSLFLTFLGFGYTIYQVLLIKSAARAAEEAANQAREEGRRRLFQFTATSVHRLINEVENYLEREEWGKAVIRLRDVADQTAQIGGQQEQWDQLVLGLREAAAACAALENERRTKPTRVKWTRLLTDLRTQLDAHFRLL